MAGRDSMFEDQAEVWALLRSALWHQLHLRAEVVDIIYMTSFSGLETVTPCPHCMPLVLQAHHNELRRVDKYFLHTWWSVPGERSATPSSDFFAVYLPEFD